MKRFAILIGMLWAETALAQEPAASPLPCEPGFKIVEEIEYKEVEHACCKVVPITKKKWVYSSKPDYYCVAGCPLHGRHRQSGCDACEACHKNCKGPYCRQQLVKKQIEWECGSKCVVEIVKEKVPCVVYRKVPCATTPAALPPGK